MQNKLYEKTMESLLHATETRTSIENNFSKEKLPAYETACKTQVDAAIKLLNMNADYELKDGTVTILAGDGSLISIPENDIKEKLSPDDYAILFPAEENIDINDDFLTDEYDMYKEQEIMPMQSPINTLLTSFINALQMPAQRNCYTPTPSDDPIEAARLYTDNLKKQNHQLKERLKNTSLELKGVTENNKVLNEKIDSLEEELTEKNNSLISLKESFKQKTSEFEERINCFNKDIEGFNHSIEEWKEKESDWQKRDAVQETLYNELTDKNSKLSIELDSVKKQYEDLSVINNELSTQNTQFAEDNDNLHKELQDLNSVCENKNLEIDSLTKKIDILTSEKEEFALSLEENKNAYDTLLTEKESLSSQITELEKNLEDERNSSKVSDETLEEISRLKAEIESLTNENKTLQESLRSFEDKTKDSLIDKKYNVKSDAAFRDFLNNENEMAKSLVLIQIHDLFEVNIRYKRKAGDFAINTVINAFAENFGKDSIYKLHGAQIVLALNEKNSKSLDEKIFNIKKHLKVDKEIKISYSIEDVIGNDKIGAFDVINEDITEYMKKKLEEAEEEIIEEDDYEEDSSNYNSLINESDGTTVDLSQSVASLFKNK